MKTKIAVLGTGVVGRTIGSKLIELGHEVRMGSRRAGNDAAVAWAERFGDAAGEGSFGDAAGVGEIVFNCTAGGSSLDVLAAAGEANLTGKVLIDVANPLDFSAGMPPTLSICNDDSLGERIQATFPEARVVKTLNTVNSAVMVEPGRVGGDHVVFVCGEDAGAKGEVEQLLESFGWPAKRIVDLGGIAAARGTEMYLPLWLQLMGATGTPRINILVEKG
jgi:8-hydroxy-5-deazaflavin:NADPH oxidoreductase